MNLFAASFFFQPGNGMAKRHSECKSDIKRSREASLLSCLPLVIDSDSHKIREIGSENTVYMTRYLYFRVSSNVVLETCGDIFSDLARKNNTFSEK